MSKILNVTKMTVIKKVSTYSETNRTTYYKLIVLQGDNAETFNCPKEVHDSVEEYKEYSFKTEFNSEYKSFRITGLLVNNK